MALHTVGLKTLPGVSKQLVVVFHYVHERKSPLHRQHHTALSLPPSSPTRPKRCVALDLCSVTGVKCPDPCQRSDTVYSAPGGAKGPKLQRKMFAPLASQQTTPDHPARTREDPSNHRGDKQRPGPHSRPPRAPGLSGWSGVRTGAADSGGPWGGGPSF